MTKPWLALALALTTAGCGIAPHASVSRSAGMAIQQAKASRAVTLEAAVANAVGFAGKQWGGSWQVVLLLGYACVPEADIARKFEALLESLSEVARRRGKP